MRSRAIRHPRGRGDVGRVLLILVGLAICVGAALLMLARDAHDSGSAGVAVHESDDLPVSVYLQRLGAADGGAWKGQFEGGRIVMWLDKNYVQNDDAYVAVLRTGIRPFAFRIYRLEVNRDGNFGMLLESLARDADGSIYVLDGPTIYVDGIVHGDGELVRFTEIRDDNDHIFPSAAELRRCSDTREEEDVRVTVKQSLD